MIVMVQLEHFIVRKLPLQRRIDQFHAAFVHRVGPASLSREDAIQAGLKESGNLGGTRTGFELNFISRGSRNHCRWPRRD